MAIQPGPRAAETRGSRYVGFTDGVASQVNRVQFSLLPRSAIDAAKLSVLDTIGVALAGWSAASPQIVARVMEETARRGHSSILGSKQRLVPLGAALVNGTLAHALDYDDTAWTYVGHPGAVLVPVILALGEPRQTTGAEVLVAYAAGFQAMSTIGQVVVREFAEHGLHLTSTIGVFGAAAAAGRILGLDDSQMRCAIGIAASRSSGLKINFGTHTKSFHAGMAARDGIEAALLAKEGFSAAPNALEGPLGYFEAMAGRRPAEEQLEASPPLVPMIEVAIKLYPSCTGTHPAIDGVLRLKEIHGFKPEDVYRVHCTVTPEVARELIHPFPVDSEQAKFSLPFAIAIALTYGKPDLSHFSGAYLQDANVQSLMSNCSLATAMDFDRVDGANAPSAMIRVELRAGTVFETVVTSARGNPDNPLRLSEIEEKFQRCASKSIGHGGQIEALSSAIMNLDQLDSVADMVALTAPRD